jgi:hypothetical protein
MKDGRRFSELKIETAQIILALQDEEILARVRSLLTEEPLAKKDIEGIDRGIADRKAGRVTPLDEYLKELEAL